MKLITITGPSGAGKDTVARMLSEMTGIPVLVSYTTRPMREDEEDGREHLFVESCDLSREDMLAYTEYGGYEYWTELSQIKETAIYVIDEAGLLDLHKRHPHIDIFSIHVEANRYLRIMRGVTSERMVRDDLRQQLPQNYFDFCIQNNGGMDELRIQVEGIIGSINNK